MKICLAPSPILFAEGLTYDQAVSAMAAANKSIVGGKYDFSINLTCIKGKYQWSLFGEPLELRNIFIANPSDHMIEV